MDNLNFNLKDFCQNEEIICFEQIKKPNLRYWQIIVCIVLALAVLTVDGFIMGAEIMSNLINNSKATKIWLYVLGCVLHLTPIIFWSYFLMKNYYLEKDSYLLVTNKKIGVISNLKTVHCKFVFFDKIKTIGQLNGNLVIFDGEEKVVFKGVVFSEEIFNKIVSILESYQKVGQ